MFAGQLQSWCLLYQTTLNIILCIIAVSSFVRTWNLQQSRVQTWMKVLRGLTKLQRVLFLQSVVMIYTAFKFVLQPTTLQLISFCFLTCTAEILFYISKSSDKLFIIIWKKRYGKSVMTSYLYAEHTVIWGHLSKSSLKHLWHINNQLSSDVLLESWVALQLTLTVFLMLGTLVQQSLLHKLMPSCNCFSSTQQFFWD